MVRAQMLLRSALFSLISLALLALLPSGLSAQDFVGNTFKVEAAILSAGTRAATVSKLEAVPGVGIVNLSIRFVPLLRTGDVSDVAAFRISADKNAKGIWRLRAALASNPATRDALASRGISIGRVVGVDIYSNGSIRVYII